MPIEVDVDFEISTRLDLMEAAANVIRIGNHTVNSRQNFEKADHRTAIQKVEHFPYVARQLLHLVKGKLPLFRLVELGPGELLRFRKIPERRLGRTDRQEIVEIDMGKRLVALICFCILCRE